MGQSSAFLSELVLFIGLSYFLTELELRTRKTLASVALGIRSSSNCSCVVSMLDGDYLSFIHFDLLKAVA